MSQTKEIKIPLVDDEPNIQQFLMMGLKMPGMDLS